TLYADSDTPHGVFLSAPYRICRRTAPWYVWSSSVNGYDCVTSTGMRYSNLLPLHDARARMPRSDVRERPRWNQCSTGTSPLAIAMNEARRASDASRSYNELSNELALVWY